VLRVQRPSDHAKAEPMANPDPHRVQIPRRPWVNDAILAALAFAAVVAFGIIVSWRP